MIVTSLHYPSHVAARTYSHKSTSGKSHVKGPAGSCYGCGKMGHMHRDCPINAYNYKPHSHETRNKMLESIKHSFVMLMIVLQIILCPTLEINDAISLNIVAYIVDQFMYLCISICVSARTV